MLSLSKRMMNNNGLVSNGDGKSWSISNKFDTIVIGDGYCGKTSYLNTLVANEKGSNSPVMISKDKNEFEFWVEYQSKKAIFVVKDTANQEKFRSLTQSYYRKAECILLIFNLYDYETFLNLSKWHSDIVNYCKKQDDRFAIVLVGLKNKPNEKNGYNSQIPVNLGLIEQFQQEKPYIIGYSEVDIGNQINLKEPFELLLDHFITQSQIRSLSPSYFPIQDRVNSPNPAKNLTNDEKYDDLVEEEDKKCCIIV